MHETPRARLIAYGLAVLAPAVLLLLRWPLWPVLGDAVPHMTFFPAVMIAAYFGGFWPGLLATGLSAVIANYFLTQQLPSFHVTSVNDVVALILFVLVGTIISGLCESLHRARRRIVADERQRAEETLRETEERFRQLAENIHEIFWMRDAQDNRITYVSPGYEEVWGVMRQELYEQPGSWAERIHPDDRDRAIGNMEQRLRGVFVASEYRIVRPDGAVRWIRSRAFPIKDQNGDTNRIAGLAEDITERKRVEEDLRASETRFRALIDHATDAFFLSDRMDGRFLDVNFQACESLGYTREELIGKTAFDIDPDFTPALKEQLSARFGPEDTVVFDTRHRRKDGSVFPVEVRVRSITVDARQCDLALVRDMTERKKIEDALRQSEYRWRSLTEALPQLVWSATPDGACDYFSTQWTQYTGVPASRLLGWQWLEVLHPDDREATRQFWTNSVAGRGAYDVEYRVRRLDGEYRWFKTRGVPIPDSEGGIFKWFGTCTDITDAKLAQEALAQERYLLHTLMDNLPDVMYFKDAASRFVRINKAQAASFGLSDPNQAIGKTDFDFFTEEHARPAYADEQDIIRTGQPVVGKEEKETWLDGRAQWMSTTKMPFRDEDGKIIGTFGVSRDITKLKLAEEALRQAKEAAEAANRAKDEFLANVSHEIRTPMNAILGMTELTLDTPLTADQRQSLKTVKSAADNLLGIINDLLDFSKIEAGKLELDPADFSLRAAAGDTMRALAMRAHKKGLELIYDVQSDVPDALVGDAGRLRQVLLNLVGNAIKFTDDGEVVVRAEVADDSVREGEVGLRFTVRDTGVGIPHDQQERIFRAFEQEDTSTTRKYGGTGLGLTIAARLVALMGGRISVESALGQGSTFDFTARFARQPHAPEPVNIRPPVLLQDLPVLIVDDNATNRRILDEWLRGWQMKPLAVGDGVAAMDTLWHSTACGRPYPLVLLDARMPDADGLALATQIRQRAELSATHIILLTSGDRPGDLARFREQRVNAHLLKPVQPDELLETIYRVMSRTNGNPPSATKAAWAREPAPGPVAAATTLRILVAEDNEFNAQLLEQLLVRRGHRVRLASNGREALRLAEEGAFDLLLLDVHMPEFDGFQVIQAIRQRERSAGGHLPVVALTARSRKEDREGCLAAGMDDFLAKPIQADDLWAAIDRVMGDLRPTDKPPADLLNPDILLAACGGDAIILEKIGKAFRSGLPDQLKAVQEALRGQDAARLREAAHKLCGTVGAFSTVAGGVASDLEEHASQGRLKEAWPLVGQLETMANELVRLAGGLSLAILRQQTAPTDDRKRVE